MRKWIEKIECHAAFLKFIGPEKERERYICCLSCGKEGDLSLKWEGSMFPARKKNQDICDERECMMVADPFIRKASVSGADGAEHFEFTIEVKLKQKKGKAV